MGLVLLLLSCSSNKDKVIDVEPLNIDIEVLDIKGNNLLDPKVPNNILKDGIRMHYKGRDFLLNEEAYLYPKGSSSLRAYMPIFRGIHITTQEKTKQPIIRIGEFDGSEEYENETIVIYWDKNETLKSTIRFTTYLRWKRGRPGKRVSSFFLNNKEVEFDPIKVILIK